MIVLRLYFARFMMVFSLLSMAWRGATPFNAEVFSRLF